MEPVVFLFDVDNTLLDNDRVTGDLRAYIERSFGEAASKRYFEIFEELRGELGYADYLGTLQRYRKEELHDGRLLRMSSYLVDYPFANRLFPESLDAIAHVQRWGTAAVLSDGDAVFQPRKIERSGIFDSVDRHVMIFIHKEEELDDVERLHPARHYVMFDDKLRILSAMKKVWGERVTTVFVRQGHYAREVGLVERYGSPDITVDRIGQVLEHDFSHLVAKNEGR